MSSVLLTCVLIGAVPGASGVLGEAQVIEEAMAHNPTLRAAVLDVRRAEEDVRAEDARYRPVLTLEAGVTHTESPSLQRTGGIVFPSSDDLVLGAELRHQFAWGTALSLSVDTNRGLSTRQAITGGDDLVQLGPSYGIVGRLTLTQPLLRGFGTEIGEAALRQARLLRTASEHARARTASELLRDVLVAYWELWYAARALDIDRAAYQLAIGQRDDARQRLASGALAPVDVLTFETRVAELDQARVASETTLKQRSVQLATLLGRSDVSPSVALSPADPAVPEPRPRLLAEVVPAAVAESYELLQLRAQAELARDQALVAGEADRPRLDLDAYVQAQGLGNEEVPPALEQFFVGDAISAHVGLVFEWPLSSARREAQRHGAALSAERAAVQVEASEQQVRSAAATELLALDQARERVVLTTATASIAARSAAAQEERYQTGGAILLEVYQAQDALRRARLGVERSRVDAAQAELRIDHLTGALLGRRAPASESRSVR